MRNLERDIRKKTISVLGRCCLNPVVDRFLCFYILFFSHFFSQLPLPYKIGFRHCLHSEGGERFRCQKFQFRLRIFLLLNISGIFRRILAFQKPRRCRDKKSRTFSEKRGSFFQKRGRFSEKRRRFFWKCPTFVVVQSWRCLQMGRLLMLKGEISMYFLCSALHCAIKHKMYNEEKWSKN